MILYDVKQHLMQLHKTLNVDHHMNLKNNPTPEKLLMKSIPPASMMKPKVAKEASQPNTVSVIPENGKKTNDPKAVKSSKTRTDFLGAFTGNNGKESDNEIPASQATIVSTAPTTSPTKPPAIADTFVPANPQPTSGEKTLGTIDSSKIDVEVNSFNQDNQEIPPIISESTEEVGEPSKQNVAADFHGVNVNLRQPQNVIGIENQDYLETHDGNMLDPLSSLFDEGIHPQSGNKSSTAGN